MTAVYHVSVCVSCPVISNSLWPHWLTVASVTGYMDRLLCPWGFPKTLEWVAISFSRASSQPKDWTWVSCIVGRFFTMWTTREAQCIIHTNTKYFCFLYYHSSLTTCICFNNIFTLKFHDKANLKCSGTIVNTSNILYWIINKLLDYII